MDNIAMLSLCVNILSLLLSIYSLVYSYVRNNLISLLYWSVFIFLVVGQGIDISTSLLNMDSVRYLHHIINRKGHLLASIAVLFVVFFTIYLNAFLKKKQLFFCNNNSKKSNFLLSIKPDNREFFYYLFNWMFVAVVVIFHKTAEKITRKECQLKLILKLTYYAGYCGFINAIISRGMYRIPVANPRHWHHYLSYPRLKVVCEVLV